MKQPTYTAISLKKGQMNLYDFGEIKLHAYKTNDPIEDEVFILEKDSTAVLIESPCFFENNRELQEYLDERGLKAEGMLLAYHMGGGTFLPGVKKYATKNAEEYGHQGGGAALISSFAQTFGQNFDSSIHTVTDRIGAGNLVIGGIEFIISPTPDAFDIEIPQINAVYTHMLGHDCHSIVAGPQNADAILAQLEGYLKRGFSMILTSHYTPEDLKDVSVKMEYIRALKALAARCGDAAEFKSAVQKAYPDYSGENYLDMTAGFFFG